MEAFSRMMFVAVTRGFIFGFLVGARNDDILSISHLFADDTVIFCGIAPNNLWYLRCVLLCFKAVRVED